MEKVAQAASLVRYFRLFFKNRNSNSDLIQKSLFCVPMLQVAGRSFIEKRLQKSDCHTLSQMDFSYFYCCVGDDQETPFFKAFAHIMCTIFQLKGNDAEKNE